MQSDPTKNPLPVVRSYKLLLLLIVSCPVCWRSTCISPAEEGLRKARFAGGGCADGHSRSFIECSLVTRARGSALRRIFCDKTVLTATEAPLFIRSRVSSAPKQSAETLPDGAASSWVRHRKRSVVWAARRFSKRGDFIGYG